MLQVGISQKDWQPSALGHTGEPELSVLASFVHGKDGGRESSRNRSSLAVFLQVLEKRGLPRLLFVSIGEEIRKSWSWDLGSAIFIRPFPLSLPQPQ